MEIHRENVAKTKTIIIVKDRIKNEIVILFTGHTTSYSVERMEENHPKVRMSNALGLNSKGLFTDGLESRKPMLIIPSVPVLFHAPTLASNMISIHAINPPTAFNKFVHYNYICLITSI